MSLPLHPFRANCPQSIGAVKPLGLSVLVAPLLPLLLVACTKKEEVAAPKATAAIVQNVDESYGTASIEEFQQRFLEASTEKDANKYLHLHCVEKLPPTLRASLTGAVSNGALNVFTFEPAKVEIEPLTEKETEQLKPADWNILPTHWIILSGKNPKQFKHWELGQFEGRYYLANRVR
ncbi:MAG: hypothetical protein R3F19_10375 [Verrucomicrobiales bacterium]